MSNQKETGGAAFPLYDHHGNGQQFLADCGMTLRDYFAAKAMQGFCADTEVTCTWDMLAEASYNVADAMLAERSKP